MLTNSSIVCLVYARVYRPSRISYCIIAIWRNEEGDWTKTWMMSCVIVFGNLNEFPNIFFFAIRQCKKCTSSYLYEIRKFTKQSKKLFFTGFTKKLIETNYVKVTVANEGVE